MASDSFIAKLRDNYNEPVFRFDYDGDDKSAYIQSIGEIRRDINLMPGYCTVTVDNTDGSWDAFITDHAELTKKGVITFGLSGFALYSTNTIAFVEGGASADTITDSSDGFITAGFKKGMVIQISQTDDNDKYVTIDKVEAGTITLIATDDLVNESAGGGVVLETEELTLFTGYVIGSDYDHDTRSMSLTMQDRLSLLLENKVQNIATTVYTASTIAFFENSTNDVTLNTIAFVPDGAGHDYITDSSNFLTSSGLKYPDVINIANSDHNNGDHTIYYIDHDTGRIYLTSSGSVTTEAEGAIITVTTTGDPFNGASTLIDSANGFVTAGLVAGMSINISGSTSNNIPVVFQNVNAGTIILLLSYTLTDEAEGDTVTLETSSNAWLNYLNLGVTRINGMTVSNLVWHLLTYFAKLDSRQSTINRDIDYDSWLAWGVDVDDGGYDIYDIGVVANGESVNDILMKIMRLSESVAWCGGEGKIKFMYGRTSGSWRQYTNEIIGTPQIQSSMEDRINYINCKWGYCPDTDDWTSDTSGVVTDSEAGGVTDTPYTYNTDYIQDRVVFHNSDSGAETYMTARLIRTANPPIYVSIVTQLLGFIEDIHTDIALQDLFDTPPYDDMGIQINEITFIPESLETRIKGQYY